MELTAPQNSSSQGSDRLGLALIASEGLPMYAVQCSASGAQTNEARDLLGDLGQNICVMIAFKVTEHYTCNVVAQA